MKAFISVQDIQDCIDRRSGSKNDILSGFFQKILYNKEKPNYFCMHTADTDESRQLVKNLFLEHFRYDNYVNQCSIQWLNLLFANVMRNYSKSTGRQTPDSSPDPNIRYYHYDTTLDYTPVFEYMRTHYREVTLDSLAKVFHYSRPYLSKIIKECTGRTFTEHIKEMKMKEAVRLLGNPTASIEAISQYTGYHSADHFSRVFTGYYGMSPQKYRKRLTQ